MTAPPPIADRCEMCQRFGRVRRPAAGSRLCDECNRWKQIERDNMDKRIAARGGSSRGFEAMLDAGAHVSAELAMIRHDCGAAAGDDPTGAKKQDNKGVGQ